MKKYYTSSVAWPNVRRAIHQHAWAGQVIQESLLINYYSPIHKCCKRKFPIPFRLRFFRFQVKCLRFRISSEHQGYQHFYFYLQHKG